MPSASEAAAAPALRAAGVPGRWADPALWLFGVLIVLLVLLVANPILRLIWDSVAASDGGTTLRHYAGAFGRARQVQALLN